MGDGAWAELKGVELEKEKRRMEIYAAMVDCIDQNFGCIPAKLQKQQKLENTLFLFASKYGGCPKDVRGQFSSTRLDNFATIAS
ncbi:MAG: hypothetical protein AAGA18_05875 [Verrucomicrobiota bacterium]